MPAQDEYVFDPHDSDHTLFVAEFEIEHEDVFHLKNIYKLAYEWFQIYGFYSLDGEGDEKWESLYFQKVLNDGKLEHHIWWRVQKVPSGSNYFKYYIKLDFQTLNMGTTDITARGKKISTNKGDLILRCKAYLLLDYDRQWKGHPILKFLDRWFTKRAYKKQVDYHKAELWILTYKLQDVIKQYMKLKTPYDMQKPFHPELGV